MTGFGASLDLPASCVPFFSPEYVSELRNYSHVTVENQIETLNNVHGKALLTIWARRQFRAKPSVVLGFNEGVESIGLGSRFQMCFMKIMRLNKLSLSTICLLFFY